MKSIRRLLTWLQLQHRQKTMERETEEEIESLEMLSELIELDQRNSRPGRSHGGPTED